MQSAERNPTRSYAEAQDSGAPSIFEEATTLRLSDSVSEKARHRNQTPREATRESARKGRDSPNDCPQKKVKTLNEDRSEGAHWQVCGGPCRIAVSGGKEREAVGCDRLASEGS